MTKILFLGIDALDYMVIEQFSDQLPNISALREKFTCRKVKSTFPPDSDTAWATIVTGLNPAQHGVVRFVDPLEKSFQIQNIGSENQALSGKTFWDVLGNAGFKTITIFPHLGYPIWETPGIMIARGIVDVDVQAKPAELLTKYPEPDRLLGVRGFPERGELGLLEHAEKLKAQALADAEFGLRLLEDEAWDLFFIYWSTIDAIGHFFWNYFDPGYPGFVEGNPLQNVILDTYKLYDEIIGKFLEKVDDDVTVIVLSDHGHGTRPFNLVNVNEILRQAGYLITRDLSKKPYLAIYERMKRAAIKIVSRYGLAKLAGKALRFAPAVKDSLTRPSNIDWDRTVAYASDQSGIKAYSYGGIIINQDALNGADYEQVRSEIMALLQEKCMDEEGNSLIEFLARRDSVYSGPYLNQYPDIVLELQYGYGLGWATNVPLITLADSKNLVPGSHRGATGTFLMRAGFQISQDLVDLHDIFPTLLAMMDVKIPDGIEGTSVIK